MYKTSDDNEYLYLDLDEVNKWIFINEKDVSDEKVDEMYNSDKKLTEMVVSKGNNIDKYSNIRYDIIKEMLTTIYTSGITSEQGDIKVEDNIERISIGARIALNSLLNKGLLKDKLQK